MLDHRVPGWPIGFGDNDKARQLLAQAVTLAPNGMDANYFYADFLITQHQYGPAYKVLKHALTLPQQKDRPLWDASRRAVLRELLAKVQANRFQLASPQIPIPRRPRNLTLPATLRRALYGVKSVEKDGQLVAHFWASLGRFTEGRGMNAASFQVYLFWAFAGVGWGVGFSLSF